MAGPMTDDGAKAWGALVFYIAVVAILICALSANLPGFKPYE